MFEKKIDLEEIRFNTVFNLLNNSYKERTYICGKDIYEFVAHNYLTTPTENGLLLYGKFWINSHLISSDLAMPLTLFITNLKKESKIMEKIKKRKEKRRKER